MLDEKQARFHELEKQLSDPEVQGNSSLMASVAREHGSLAKLAGKYGRFKVILSDLDELKEMAGSSDEEEAEMAKAEIETLTEEREVIWAELLDMTIGGEDANRTRCVMEIRAGTGGDEAALFAGDLLRMYQRYADGQKWSFELLEYSESELGGVKEVVARVAGEGVFARMKYESGVHRVQRVPETESGGRIHTSAATVAVLPEAEDVDIQINAADIRLDTMRASGSGGQHVNTTDSAVRILHIPTGIIVVSSEKSQHRNREIAMQVLKTRLFDLERQKVDDERSADRKSQVGSGDRSERIRTYNFPQGRMTDHRINLTLYSLGQVMQGELDEIIDALQADAQAALMAEMGG
jgi:peptide chain release factor 1